MGIVGIEERAPVEVRAAEPFVLLEWYDFGPTEWAHVRAGVLSFFLGTVLPMGSFYLVYRVLTFQLAVLAVLTWALAVFAWHYWRAREFDVFSMTTVALACLKATAGVVSGSQTLYLVWPSMENLLYGSVFLGSALLGWPLLAVYAARLYPIPAAVTRMPAFRKGFLGASLAWAVGSCFRAALRVWLVGHLSLETFLLVDSAIGWPVNLALIWFTAWYPLRTLEREGHLLP